MNPYNDQRIIDEVFYLHSLWHQGPPRSTSSNHSVSQPSCRTQFKRNRAKRRAQAENRRNRHRIIRNQGGEGSTVSVQDSGKEWPINPTSNDAARTYAWPTAAVQSNSQSLWHSAEPGKELPCITPTSGLAIATARQNSQRVLLSPERRARFAHFNALKTTKDFFGSNNSDDDDELGDDNESDEDEGLDDFTEDGYGSEECRFFVGVFEEDSELRDYYEKNYQNGDFICLVCCAVGLKNASKKFKDCVALIQHSVSIAKTKKRRAHRAYGKAICKVLGWDIHKLPTIVSALSGNFGVPSSNSGPGQGVAQPSLSDERGELEVAFSASEIKDKYKDATLLPQWKAFRSLIFLERVHRLNDSRKIAAFDFEGCLVNTSVESVGADAWSLMYPSIPDKLQELYNDAYKLVIFTNESDIECWEKKRQMALDSKIGRLENFIEQVKVPIQVFIACALSPGQPEDPFRKPKPGMWHIMEKQFNSGLEVDMDNSFYVGDAAGRPNDHRDADIKFAEAIGLKFYVPEQFFT